MTTPGGIVTVTQSTSNAVYKVTPGGSVVSYNQGAVPPGAALLDSSGHIAQGVVPDLSGIYAPQPSLAAAAYPLYVYGNSYAVIPGLRCTAGKEYPTTLAAALGATVTGRAVSGTRVNDAAVAMIAGASAWPGDGTSPGLCVLDAEFNDVGHYPDMTVSPAVPAAITTANTRYKDGITGNYRTALAVLSSDSRVEQTAATLAGTWATAGGPYSGGSTAYTTTPASSATFTVTPPQSGPHAGKVFVLGYKLDTTVGTMAQVTWQVDAQTAVNYTPTGWEEYKGSGGGQVNVIPDVITITGIPVDGAAHTVKITHSGTAGQYLYVDAVLVPSATPNPVLVMQSAIPNVQTFTQAQVNIWRSNFALLDPAIQAVVAEFGNAVWVPCTVTSNGISQVDGIHPNDRGMAQRLNDAIQACRSLLPRFQNRSLQQASDSKFATL